MIVVLFYPPAQLIGETDDVAPNKAGNLEPTGVPGSRPGAVRFERLAELVYYTDPHDGLCLSTRGLGKWSVGLGTWAGWREPTNHEREAWALYRAAEAGIALPGKGGQPGPRPVS